MAEFKKLHRVRYISQAMPMMTGKQGVVVEITPRGWVEVKFDGTDHTVRCAQSSLELVDPRQDLLQGLFEMMTAYLVDECPEGQDWEDFDPDIDSLRAQVSELGGGL